MPTFIDLIKITSVFYNFKFHEDLTRKTMIELRPDIPGYYKGLIYCKGLDQAEEVKNRLDIDLDNVFDQELTSKVKRGCSEYPVKFPNYGKIPQKPESLMSYPNEWNEFEKKFDQKNLIVPNEGQQASLSEFCLSDFFIIQKWIDYAKAIGDQSVEVFSDSPIIYKNVYETAKSRSR